MDLAFYHRILKCLVLIELKAEQFKHQDLSQPNTYVSYYREEAFFRYSLGVVAVNFLNSLLKLETVL